MSWTGIHQIRNHLYRLDLGEEEIRNHPVTLSADAHTKLPHAHIAASSETIKAVIQATPVSETVTLNDDAVSLSHPQTVGNTVVCAADSSLTVIYEENSDYSVDYAAGTIRRIEDGAIPSGNCVTVWYVYHHVYQRNVDYTIDYERGRIRRIGSGDIEDGQGVLVDYQLGGSEFSDAEIEQAIAEAEAEMSRLIDTAYQHVTDPGLQTAATYLALSLLCRNAAGVTAGSSTVSKSASAWLELSESYRETAMRLLEWFRSKAPGLRFPRLT